MQHLTNWPACFLLLCGCTRTIADIFGFPVCIHPLPTNTTSTAAGPGTPRCACGGRRCTPGTPPSPPRARWSLHLRRSTCECPSHTRRLTHTHTHETAHTRDGSHT